MIRTEVITANGPCYNHITAKHEPPLHIALAYPGFPSLWKGQRYGTSRVHGVRMCLTIKLFWVKSALISFHNISVLQGLLVRERSAEITCFKHAGTLARTLLGSLILICRASSPGSRNRTAHAAVSSRAIGSPVHTR